MLSATPVAPTPVGDASFALYDNSVTATATANFSRDVETLDGLGNLVAPDERRFGDPLQYTPTISWDISERWEEIKDELFVSFAEITVKVLGSGWDHDGQTPLAVLRTSGNYNSDKLIFVRGEEMEVVGTLPLSIYGRLDQLEVDGKSYRPETLIVHQGLVVIAVERYEAGLGSVGVDFFTTQDYGQTLEQVPFLGGGSEVPPIEGGVTQGIKRLQTWSFLNAFPVNGIDDTESVWFPWADYLGKESTVKPKGGQIGLFRADRSAATGEWVLSPNRLVHTEWNLEDTGGFHAHAAAVTTGGVVSHWGDVGYRNVTKFHQFDLNDYQNATITTTDVFGGSDFSGETYNIAPQPVATAPSPVPGEHFASGDLTPEHVLSFGALQNTGDQLEIEAKIFQARRTSRGNVHSAPTLLHMHWVQGVGYVTGGRGDGYFYYSPDGYRWAEVNSPDDQTGTMWIYGDRLLKSKGNRVYTTGALPEVETIRPLQISPGGQNVISNQLDSYREPGTGNTRRQVLYQNAAWRYADTLVPLDVQAPAPHFPSSAPVYEITVGSESTDLGGWWLDSEGQTHDAASPYITEAWVTNLADQSFHLGMGHRVIGDSSSSAAPLRFYQVADTTQWLSLGASQIVDSPFSGDGRFAVLLNSYYRSPGARFLVAIPYAGDSLAPTYSQAPQATGPDESESVTGLQFDGNWSVGLVARWPDNSQQLYRAKMPIASLTGASDDAVEISFEYKSSSRETQLRVDFFKTGNLVHSEVWKEDLLRGDWVEIITSEGPIGTTVTYGIAGQAPTVLTNLASHDLSLDDFQWAGRDGDTVTGIDPVLAVFDNDLAWNAQQHQEWTSLSLSNKATFQARPGFGDYNFDGKVDAADYTVWRDSIGSTEVGQLGDFNLDGDVNFLDHAVWASEFGQTGPGLVSDMNTDGVVDLRDYTLWRDSKGAQPLPGAAADGDRSSFIDQPDLTVWQQFYGTHYPTLEELRTTSAGNSSTGDSSTDNSASSPPALLHAAEVETDAEIQSLPVAFVLSPDFSSTGATDSPHLLIGGLQRDSQDLAWELLVTEETFRTPSTDADAVNQVDRLEEAELEKDAQEETGLGQDNWHDLLIDEAIAVLVL